MYPAVPSESRGEEKTNLGFITLLNSVLEMKVQVRTTKKIFLKSCGLVKEHEFKDQLNISLKAAFTLVSSCGRFSRNLRNSRMALIHL